MVHIKSARLLLAPLERAHIPALIELWTDPDVTRFMGGPRKAADLATAFDGDIGSTEPFDLWPVLLKSSRMLIGYAGIIPKSIGGREEHELIYVFAKPFWGQGYATEIGQALVAHAERRLGLDRVVALVDPENNASAHVALKLGFVLERSVPRDDGHVKNLYCRTAAKSETAA